MCYSRWWMGWRWSI